MVPPKKTSMREKLTKSSNFIVVPSPFAPIVPGVCSSYGDKIMDSNEKIKMLCVIELKTSKSQGNKTSIFLSSVSTSPFIQLLCGNSSKIRLTPNLLPIP